jgi:hypothetical protein
VMINAGWSLVRHSGELFEGMTHEAESGTCTRLNSPCLNFFRTSRIRNIVGSQRHLSTQPMTRFQPYNQHPRTLHHVGLSIVASSPETQWVPRYALRMDATTPVALSQNALHYRVLVDPIFGLAWARSVNGDRGHEH